MRNIVVGLVLWLAGCAAAAPPADDGRRHEPGFSRFCAEHPHHGTCP